MDFQLEALSEEEFEELKTLVLNEINRRHALSWLKTQEELKEQEEKENQP